MSLKIIKAGICDTIQDAGRYGFQQFGVNPGGVMDSLTMQTANLLVGNNRNEAVIEMCFPAPTLLFEAATVIVLGGADFSAIINDEQVPLLHPVFVEENSLLRFHQWKKGRCCYLALHGGLQIRKWLGSYATNTKVKAGGWHGRALQKNDVIPYPGLPRLKTIITGKSPQVFNWGACAFKDDSAADDIYVLPGAEWSSLTEDSKELFTRGSFSITASSDRMGFTLTGPLLLMHTQYELVSSAVQYGTIQLLPGGQIITLMADHQTTGGYPRIAHVIKAHWAKLAQKKEDNLIRFRVVAMSTAETLLLQQEQHLIELKNACALKWQSLFEN